MNIKSVFILSSTIFDDKQIVKAKIEKKYSSRPRIELTVEEVEGRQKEAEIMHERTPACLPDQGSRQTHRGRIEQ